MTAGLGNCFMGLNRRRVRTKTLMSAATVKFSPAPMTLVKLVCPTGYQCTRTPEVPVGIHGHQRAFRTPIQLRNLPFLRLTLALYGVSSDNRI